MARLWRTYHPDAAEADRGLISLLPEEAHHVRRVLRLRTGDPIAVFDGRGSEWRASIVDCDAGRVTARLEEALHREVESAIRIVLYQVECRSEAMDWLVQKATELGVAAIVIVDSNGPRDRVRDSRLERWSRIAVESAKQSGRVRLPVLERGPAFPPPPVSGVLALLLDPTAGANALGAVAQRAQSPTEIWVGVGPEAGIDEGRMLLAEQSGWQRVSVGPRILRAETAGVTAVVLAQHLWGDLGRLPALAAPNHGP